jgi:hypothetical protein
MKRLLCLIDDAQWFDQSSVQVLAFLARRLEAESVVLVFAERGPDELDELAGLPELRLQGCLKPTRRNASARVRSKTHLLRTTSGSATRLDSADAVHRYDVGDHRVRSPEILACAMRDDQPRSGRGRRGVVDRSGAWYSIRESGQGLSVNGG